MYGNVIKHIIYNIRIFNIVDMLFFFVYNMNHMISSVLNSVPVARTFQIFFQFASVQTCGFVAYLVLVRNAFSIWEARVRIPVKLDFFHSFFTAVVKIVISLRGSFLCMTYLLFARFRYKLWLSSAVFQSMWQPSQYQRFPKLSFTQLVL